MINDGSSLSRATTAAATAAHSDAFFPLFVRPTFTFSEFCYLVTVGL